MATRFRTEGRFIVASVERAGALLMSTRTRSAIGACVSIADPHNGKRPPRAGLAKIPRTLFLTFDDVASDAEGLPPSLDDVARVLRFGASLPNDDTRVLVHCFAGVSRSSAAALAIIAQDLGHGAEADAVQQMMRACEKRPSPNALMVRYADTLLGRGGALIEGVAMAMAMAREIGDGDGEG